MTTGHLSLGASKNDEMNINQTANKQNDNWPSKFRRAMIKRQLAKHQKAEHNLAEMPISK
jgi:hypothetical protein